MVDRDLATAKLAYIAANLRILEDKSAVPEAEFLLNTDCQYVVLHAMQLAIQAAMDLAAHVVADEGWEAPERSSDSFPLLGDKQVLDAGLAQRLRKMASFRNLIVHEYAEVNLRSVYRIWHESVTDLRQFAEAVTAYFSIDR